MSDDPRQPLPDLALEVRSLTRGDKPAERASGLIRRTLAVVAEWPEGAGFDLTIAAGVRRGAVGVRFDGFGPLPGEWRRDVIWAVGANAEFRKQGRTVETVTPQHIVELRAEREFAPGPLAEDNDTSVFGGWPEGPRRRAERGQTPWPTARFDDARGLVSLIAEAPEFAARFRVAAAGELEREMITDELRGSWTGADDELHFYLGAPVRLRVLLGSTAGPVPARLAAVGRHWASDLRLLPLSGADAERAWAGDPVTLAGQVVPNGMAMGLLRFPVAGRSPVPGMRSKLAGVAGIPLDPIPAKPVAGLRLGSAFAVDGRRLSVELAVTDLLRHLGIEGASGSGKSTCLLALVSELARLGIGYTLMTSHPETIVDAARLQPRAALDRTILIQHGRDDARFPLNILLREGDALDRIIDAFAEMIQDKDDPRGEGMVGMRWRRWFALVCLSVVAGLGDRATLVAVAAIAADQVRVAQLARKIASTHPELAHRLQKEFVNLESKESTELTSWAVSKLHPLISGDRVRGILGAGPSPVDVAAVMDEGGALLIDLAMPTLGVPAAKMLGALWIMEHYMAMGRRADPSKPHIIICDEAHLFQYGALPSLLAEGRKFGIGVVIATQDLSRLRPALAEGLEVNAGGFLTLRSSPRTAARSAARLGGWRPEQLTRLADLTAAATLSIGGELTEPFTLTIDHWKRAAKSGRTEQQSEDALAYLAERSKRLFSDPYEELDALTDAQIAGLLAAPQRSEALLDEREPARQAARATVRPRPVRTPAPAPRPRMMGSDDEAVLLDEWMARRAAAVAAAVSDGDG